MSKIMVGGTEHDAVLTMGTLVRFRDKAGYDFLKEPGRMDAVGLAIMAWAGIATAAKRDGKEFDTSWEELADSMTIPEVNGLQQWIERETSTGDSDDKGKKKATSR